MQAKDVMTSSVLTVSPETSVREIARLLLERHISAAPVVDKAGHLVGIVSKGDLMRRPESGTERHASWWLNLISDPRDEAREYLKTHGLHARDVMTRQVVSVAEDAPLQEIAGLLEKHRIKRVPVIRDGKIVGIVSRSNLLQALVVQPPSPGPLEADDQHLRQAVQEAIRETGARASFVNVVAAGGIVHLWGVVYSDEERRAISLAAEATPGAKEVREQISIVPRLSSHAG